MDILIAVERQVDSISSIFNDGNKFTINKSYTRSKKVKSGLSMTEFWIATRQRAPDKNNSPYKVIFSLMDFCSRLCFISEILYLCILVYFVVCSLSFLNLDCNNVLSY